jgi:hypothetical protein
MNDAAPHTPQPTRSRLAWLGPALAGVVGALYLARIRGVGLVGHDSYPLVLTARIRDLGDLAGTFTESLMDGRYPGLYHRPLLNLSFALDHALWGLEPEGYQVTGALLFALTGFALFVAARRALGGALPGALAALLVFLLHESQLEVLPVPARRPELLCAACALAGLAAQLHPRRLASRWPVVPALWMLGAAASKETGYVLPAVAVLAVYLYAPDAGRAARLGRAARAALVHAVVVGALLALRLVALGGPGGPAPLPPGFEGPGPLELTATLLGRVVVTPGHEPATWPLWIAAFAALGVLKAWVLGLRPAEGSGPTPETRAARAALVLGLTWLALVAGIYGVSRSIEAWYLLLPVVGLALLVGSGVELLRLQWTRGGPLARASAVSAALLLACFALLQVRHSPLWTPDDTWERATAASDEFFRRLSNRIERAAPGGVVNAPPLPLWVAPPERGPGVRGGAVLEAYSVQAWAELVHPERRLRVEKGPAGPPPAADEVVIRLMRPLPL